MSIGNMRGVSYAMWFWVVFLGIFLGACGGGGSSGDSGSTAEPTNPATPMPVVYKTYGINFSPYLYGQDPGNNQRISDSQIQSRLEVIAPYTQWIRTYGSKNGLENIPRIAKSLGLKVAAGAYLSTNAVANVAEIENLISIGQSGQADILIVGNETLQFGQLTEAQLIGFIRQVRSAVPPSVQVTTTDTFDAITAHPALINEVDVVAVNIYPYFDGVDIAHAVADLDAKYSQLKAMVSGKDVIVAETGWPSGGVDHGNASVSPTNAASYFVNFVSWARANSVGYFYFEAFDEAWKVAVEGLQGSHWGVWDENGVMKSGMWDVFDGKTVPDNWSGGGLVGGSGTPMAGFSSVPPIGSTDYLRGYAVHIVPADYKVAVYIQVYGGWWTKPYFGSPLTTIMPDGTWSCNIVTGGSDQYASGIAAFLVPNGYSPMLLSGSSSLPSELTANYPSVIITR